MRYLNVVEGRFVSRPNRFVANVMIDGSNHVVHVKNTGRCKELLVDDAQVFLEDCDSPKRKTRFDLIGVFKGDRLINMDSQVPNLVVEQWLLSGGFFRDIHVLKRERVFGNSRFDFYVEYEDKKAFVEVKGVTLERDNVAIFPDAPTSRGVKHLNELVKAKSCGFESFVIFVIQMEGVSYFTPNFDTDPLFCDALREAYSKGVGVLAFDCFVCKDSIEFCSMVEVRL